MSALLDIVRDARELRDRAESEFRIALVRAAEGGASLRQIGQAAGVSFSGARWLIRRARGEIDGHGNTTREEQTK